MATVDYLIVAGGGAGAYQVEGIITAGAGCYYEHTACGIGYTGQDNRQGCTGEHDSTVAIVVYVVDDGLF